MGHTFVYNTGKAEELEDTFKVEFGVFIDGTLNNKDNSRVRKVVNNEQEHGETATPDEIAKYKKAQERGFWGTIGDFLLDSTTGSDYTDTSYGNDYSNVARKWECSERYYRIYIEGMGTDNLQKDSKEGFAFGSGLTGVRARVRKACEEVVKKILDEQKNNKNKKLNKITLDVFGFSRGATSARNFVNEVNVKKEYPPKKSKIPNGVETVVYEHGVVSQQLYKDAIVDNDGIEIDDAVLDNGKLPRMGHLGYCLLRDGVLTIEELKEIKINIRVLGIYDTVSSYYEKGGMATYDENGKLVDDEFLSKSIHVKRHKFNYYDNTKELGLHDLGSIEKPVHFTAKDEHRENFPVTYMRQGIEKHFPGVHCDIGGAYENGPEKKKDLENTNNMNILALYDYKQKLIDEHWFKDDEIRVALFSSFPSKKIKTHRKMVRKEYSYIPLHFMERFCKETEMIEKIILSTEQKYNLDNDNILVQAKNHLEDYVFNNGEEWEFEEEAVYQERMAERKRKREERERAEALEKFIKQMEELNKPSFIENNTSNSDPFETKKIEEQEKEKSEEKEKVTTLDEVVVIGYDSQTLLRKLRNEYFHWSASRAGFGLDPNTEPTTNRKRVKYL
ncbi:MAG: DUF2235 domain-containing protein [Limnohabitans sp.]|nr:DUF2235 domain-containing protein [Limnohabitans sp.]